MRVWAWRLKGSDLVLRQYSEVTWSWGLWPHQGTICSWIYNLQHCWEVRETKRLNPVGGSRSLGAWLRRILSLVFPLPPSLPAFWLPQSETLSLTMLSDHSVSALLHCKSNGASWPWTEILATVTFLIGSVTEMKNQHCLCLLNLSNELSHVGNLCVPSLKFRSPFFMPNSSLMKVKSEESVLQIDNEKETEVTSNRKKADKTSKKREKQPTPRSRLSKD